jgi:hypothetical protein
MIQKLFTHPDPSLRVNSIGMLGRFALATMSDDIAKV